VNDVASAPLRAGLVSVAVGAVVLSLKAFAALRTGSLALLSDAAESVVNVVAAIVATASIRYSARPADANHPFGHGKVEYLSAGIEGALVVLAAFVVAFEAVTRFGQSPRLPALGLGLGVSVVATAANALLSRYLERIGRRARSPALLADALHVRSDVVTSLAVYGGFGLAWATQYWALDALLALGVSVHILISGLRAVRHSMAGLLDEALPPDELRSIEARLALENPPVLEYHDLRTRRAAAQVFVEFHLVIRRDTTVLEAHDICDRIEADLRAIQPGARVTIHVEPEGEAKRGSNAAAANAEERGRRSPLRLR
jgi:cation diffusion facilitator family transporter